MSVGGVIGTVTKIDALLNDDTVWPRRSSGLNAIFFIPTVLAFFTIELYLTTLTSATSFVIWTSIYLFRAPEHEDWLGRTKPEE